MYFGRDIETIQKIYQRHRNEPPIAWDLPPIAGKIAWARQMYRRIQEPMEMFQKYPTILQTPEAKKIIKNYNKLAKVLLEFEVLYHQAWMQQVELSTYMILSCNFVKLNLFSLLASNVIDLFGNNENALNCVW